MYKLRIAENLSEILYLPGIPGGTDLQYLLLQLYLLSLVAQFARLEINLKRSEADNWG